jgi:DNA-directed RNA polymerase specialized sigma24 family protein
MPENYGKTLPIDPRMIEIIQRSPKMLSEQGDLMAEWGGPEMYKVLARLPVNQRMTYFAVKAGIKTPEEISAVLDIPLDEVNSSLDSLVSQGLVTSQVSNV